MKSIIINKYVDIDINSLNKQELTDLKRSLECDISWVEHDLKNMTLNEDIDTQLDLLNLYKNLYKKVSKQM